MPQEGGEELVLNAQGDVLALAHLRLPVAQQVEEKDLPVAGQFGADPPPDMGGKRRAVDEDGGPPFAEDVVGDRLPPKLEGPGE